MGGPISHRELCVEWGRVLRAPSVLGSETAHDKNNHQNYDNCSQQAVT